MSTIEGPTPMPTHHIESPPTPPAAPVVHTENKEQAAPPTEKKQSGTSSREKKGAPKKSGVGNEDVVLFGKSEDSGKKEREVMQALRRGLDGVAMEKFGMRSYGELPIEEKLSALESYLQESKEVSASTREAIGRIQDIIASPPEPDQLDRIKKTLAMLPEQEDFYSLEAEIQRRIKEGLVVHVIDHQDEFGVDRYGVSRFAGEIGETSIGQIPPEEYKFYDSTKNYTDANLKRYLQEIQEKYDMLGYTRGTPISIEQEIEFKKKELDALLARATGADAFDKTEAQTVIRGLNADIEALSNYERELIYGQRRSQSNQEELKGAEPRDAKHLIEIIEQEMGTRYQINTDDVRAAYDNLKKPDGEPDLEQQNAFVREAKKRIRSRIAELEELNAPWRLENTIDRRISAINVWLDMIKNVDPEKWEPIRNEAEGRQWLHEFYQTLRQGSSPMDTKDLMRPMQGFDKMEIREAISNMPGVWKAHQLLERDYDKLLAAETNPDEWKKIFNNIADELEKMKVPQDPKKPDSPLVPLLDPSEGIDKRTAVQIAYRHYHETGRDAQRYALYMEKNNCIRFRKKNRPGPLGKLGLDKYTTYEVDPHAPQLWNAFRLTYYSKAMWSFFQFGSNMEGIVRPITVKVPDWKGGFKEKTFGDVRMGQGVGADAMEALLNYNYSSCLTDFYSRRNGSYVIPAWIDEKVRAEQREGNLSEATKEEHALYFRNKNKIDDINKLKDAEKDYKAYFGKMAIDYCIENDIPVSDKVDLDIVRAKYNDAADRADAHEKEMKARFGENYRNFYKNGSQEVIPSMEHFDIRNVPWGSILRNQENVRGNFRDHFAGLQVNDAVGKFIVDPTLANFEKFDWHMMVIYTQPADAMQHFVLPGYLTLRDMNRGPWLSGKEAPLAEFLPWGLGKSKLGKVRGVLPMDDKQLYEVGRWAVAQGGLSPDMIYKFRGGWFGRLLDKRRQYLDSTEVLILFLALASELKSQVEKDSKGA